MSSICDNATRVRIPRNHRGGKPAAEMLPIVYDELRKLARRRLARERMGQSIEPTSLVHEAYLRVAADEDACWDDRAHFFSAAAIAMRRILVERARRRKMAKHGGGLTRVSFDDFAVGTIPRDPDLIALDEALTRLQLHDKRAGDVVMLRFFAGLDVEETARTLGVSAATIDRDWKYAKAWLYREISRNSSGDE